MPQPVHPKNIAITDFQYNLPDERIAVFPLAERDQSKLLYFKDHEISDHQFQEIAELLPAKSLLVFNNTKVVQARLLFLQPTGTVIEIFCLEPLAPVSEIQLAMQQTGTCIWRCLVGNAKKWKTETITLTFEIAGKPATLTARKSAPEEGSFEVTFTWNPADFTFAEILAAAGNLPLPPYFKRAATTADQNRYQTIYASQEGAVAAPTAGLHFTPAVMHKLQQQNIQTAYLTLHVGAGTFRPVKAEKMAEHAMHAEQIVLSVDLIETLLHHWPNPVIPVGTTSMRTLESLYWLGCMVQKNPEISVQDLTVPQWLAYENDIKIPVPEALEALLILLKKHKATYLPASTSILIAPGYDFKLCAGLVTNFHQPGSTLLLLVAALIGDDWKKIYDHALQHNYRFLSYGDSSLLLKRS